MIEKDRMSDLRGGGLSGKGTFRKDAPNGERGKRDRQPLKSGLGEHVRTTKKVIGLIMLIAGTWVYAQEAVPREDFIAVTHKVIHALDEVEAACYDPESGKQAVDTALKKLRTARDEYKRYDVNLWALDGDQEEIVKTVAAAERSYKIFSLSLGPCCAAPTEDEIIHAAEYSEHARRLFLKYKAKE